MKFRFMNDEDKEAVKWLWDYCFDDTQSFSNWYFKEYYRGENTLGLFQNDKLLSSLQLIPYDIYLRGQIFPVSYIVGVGTIPEARRGGLIKKLLQASLEEMQKRNHAISLLMPFQAQFYYPYQWEFCYHHYKYLIPLEDLRLISEPYGEFLPIIDMNNPEKIHEVYQDFIGDKHGFVVRNKKNWHLTWGELKAEEGFAYLLENKEEPEGYVFYFLKDNKLVVKEMAYRNIKAQKSLFQFLYNHRSQVEFLEWHAPIDDTTHYFLPDPKRGVSLYPFLTARIVDVEKLLSTICFPQEIEIETVLNIQDSLASWNNQNFYLKINNGKTHVYPVNGKPEVFMSIGALSQLVFGNQDVWQLIYQERLKVKNQAQAEILNKLFPRCNNYINEYY